MMKTKMKGPDLVEVGLIGISAIWTIVTLALLRQAATMPEINLISWTSLTAFFVGFGGIVLLVIAILLADIRKKWR